MNARSLPEIGLGEIFTCRAGCESHHRAPDLVLREIIFVQKGKPELALGPSVTFVQVADGSVDGPCVFPHAEIRVRDYQADGERRQRDVAAAGRLLVTARQFPTVAGRELDERAHRQEDVEQAAHLFVARTPWRVANASVPLACGAILTGFGQVHLSPERQILARSKSSASNPQRGAASFQV